MQIVPDNCLKFSDRQLSDGSKNLEPCKILLEILQRCKKLAEKFRTLQYLKQKFAMFKIFGLHVIAAFIGYRKNFKRKILYGRGD